MKGMSFALSVLLAGELASFGQDKPAGGRGHRLQGVTNTFNLSVPARAFDLLLVRPEAASMTLSVLAHEEMSAYVSYGPESAGETSRTLEVRIPRESPGLFVLDRLQENMPYGYTFHWRRPAAAEFASSSHRFHTARTPGSGFVFTLTADVHLDEHTSSQVYERSLANIRADRPDFHLDLGNLFMTDKHATRTEAEAQYAAQRYYLGRIGDSVPVMLALGTHDGEAARYDDVTAECLATWANLTRKRYFLNPVPDAFFSGNGTAKAQCGLPQNYYAWHWGDALFVVLDPFGYSNSQRGGKDGWGWSLGPAQYQWLARTLEQSRARFKFVFIHNLLCGDAAARGGVEVAAFNEWGGRNLDGTEGFKAHRPGWAEPVHALLVRNHVAAVFKAHDNFYARQELEGILYLMVPQPSFAGNDRIRDLENYGYKQGVLLGNSGHVRVGVSPDQATVEYVKATQPRAVADRCTISFKR
jgi:hypothetical protein